MTVNNEPVKVHIQSTDVTTERRSAEFGSWQTYLINSAWAPQQVLKRNLRRRRAVIIAQPTVSAQPVTDGIILGTQAQTNGNQALPDTLGGFLAVGFNITVEDQQEVWCAFPAANTDAIRLLVLDELYSANNSETEPEYQDIPRHASGYSGT